MLVAISVMCQGQPGVCLHLLVSLLSSRLQYRRQKALPLIGCFVAIH